MNIELHCVDSFGIQVERVWKVYQEQSQWRITITIGSSKTGECCRITAGTDHITVAKCAQLLSQLNKGKVSKRGTY